jgi:predicted enzyme related to lactoylglutathione lyase
VKASDICHAEIRTHDLGRAKAFYGWAFDWKICDLRDGYAGIRTGASPAGGLVEVSAESWLGVCAFALVEDCEETARRAQALGALCLTEAREEPAIRTLDPWGNEIGFCEGACADGATLPASGENRFCWLELSVTSREDAEEYYGELLGWSFLLDPGHVRSYAHTDFERKVFGVGLRLIHPGEKLQGSLNHILVDDLAAAATLISARGGRLLSGAREIPHVGFFNDFADTENNRLAIFSETPPR